MKEKKETETLNTVRKDQTTPKIKRLQYNPELCFYCEEKITNFNRTVDHLVPRAQGGSDHENNKVPCCQDCNSLKGNRTPFQFMKAIELARTEMARTLKRNMYRYNKICENINALLDAQGKGK